MKKYKVEIQITESYIREINAPNEKEAVASVISDYETFGIDSFDEPYRDVDIHCLGECHEE